MISNLSFRFVEEATKEAEKSDYKVRVGCIIFKGKRIISRGYNQNRSLKKLHPKFQKWKGSVHAEVSAIIEARQDLKNTDMLVVRINKKNQLRLSKPCKDCMKYIDYVGIRNIYYSISEYPYIEKIGKKRGD